MTAEQFKTKEGIQLPNKLYILFPKSCKVKKYIDKSDCIEYTKNFLAFKLDHGGIKAREYHISVYRIDYNGKFFYCALEYAQPLKNLRALKENGKMPLSEMYAERDSFIKNLTQMLQDRENSFEVCELVEYDDENSELHDILSNLPSVQKYKRQTIE
ncbi:Stimulator of interferon like [Argiope bruennichi]|uniref:Stimulator of interferon like n=2 Tax=Argiope bruennichi TaxID=94029 RepID=A0A8T0FPG2_ARGBR|nr:Stimulator of interferon like [Argiope bruennichi]